MTVDEIRNNSEPLWNIRGYQKWEVAQMAGDRGL